MSAAPAPQTLGPEEYEQEVEAHEGRVAGAGEARGIMREQTGALAQAMGDEGDGGSVGGGGARTIDDTDDFTALLMNVSALPLLPPLSPRHFHALSPAPAPPADDALRGGPNAGQPEAHRGLPEPRD